MTKIEWTERTWNPIVGCSIVSPGCTNCYAMRMAARLENMSVANEARTGGDLGPLYYYRGLTQESRAGWVWTGKVKLAPEDVLLKPLRRRKPTMWFVNSMSDLFHEDVPDEWIDRVFAVMALTPQHTYQVLTKRAKRMREYLTSAVGKHYAETFEKYADQRSPHWVTEKDGERWLKPAAFPDWPLSNVWLGISCERQQKADERIPDLLATPAALRFVSAEPLLGPIDFTALQSNRQPEEYEAEVTNALTGELFWEIDGTVSRAMRRTGKLDWIIVGGESGPGARPMVLVWAKDIVRQCKTAGVPVFVKQLGAEPTNREGERCPHIKQKKGADVSEWPAELRVREWPHA